MCVCVCVCVWSHSSFVLLALLSDRCVVAATGRHRPVQSNGDADARDADQNHRHQIDDDEQQQEEPATELAEVVEAVGADLARRDAVATVYGERVTAAVEVGRRENERH